MTRSKVLFISCFSSRIHHLALVLPKQNSVFSFRIPLYDNRNVPSSTESSGSVAPEIEVPQMEFELYGNQFRFRAAERAGRKFKHKESIAL